MVQCHNSSLNVNALIMVPPPYNMAIFLIENKQYFFHGQSKRKKRSYNSVVKDIFNFLSKTFKLSEFLSLNFLFF